MLLVAQFPFADMRAFIPAAHQRLSVPYWPDLNPNSDFVRSFGHVRRRKWTPEIVDEVPFYCDARQALKLPFLEKARWGCGQGAFMPACAFRRLLCETSVGGAAQCRAAYRPIGWVEAGFINRIPRVFTGQEAIGVVMDMMDLTTEVLCSHSVRKPADSNGPRPRAKGPLVRQAVHLARLYLHASTETPSKWDDWPPDSLVRYGEPLFIIEHSASELSSLPEHSTKVSPMGSSGGSLAFVRLRYHNSEFGLWFIGADRLNQNKARGLRLSIQQMHAQQQSLRQVLLQIASKAIHFVPRTTEGDKLQEYLNDVTRLLSREQRDGSWKRELLDVINAYEAFVNAHQFSALLYELQGARRQILAKVESYLSNQKLLAHSPVYAMAGAEVIVTSNFAGPGGTVNNTTVKMGDGNTFTGDFVVGSTLQNSMNKIMKSPLEEQTQAVLKELHDQMRQLCEKLSQTDPSAAAGVSRDLDSFISEATAPKPRGEKLKDLGKGLVDSAKTVAELAGPVISAVSLALKLFGVAVP